MLAKRLTLSLLAIGVISLVVTAASFALFTATTTNTSNTFTTGTVTLDLPTTTLVDVPNIAPGDSGTATYEVKYTGSLKAYLGLTTDLGGELTTCDGGKFHVTIVDDDSKSYNPDLADQLVGEFLTNETVKFDIAWNLDSAAGNACQAKAAQLSLMVKAVQWAHNNTPAGPISW